MDSDSPSEPVDTSSEEENDKDNSEGELDSTGRLFIELTNQDHNFVCTVNADPDTAAEISPPEQQKEDPEEDDVDDAPLRVKRKRTAISKVPISHSILMMTNRIQHNIPS